LTKVKEDIQLIDYLKEKGIKLEDLKTMIEESVDTALEESEVEVEEKEVELPQEEESEPEEVPTFTKDDIKQLISDEVMKSLKIKRKVPSKGKIVDKTDIQKEPASETKRAVATKDWCEVIV